MARFTSRHIGCQDMHRRRDKGHEPHRCGRQNHRACHCNVKRRIGADMRGRGRLALRIHINRYRARTGAQHRLPRHRRGPTRDGHALPREGQHQRQNQS